jgi:hypothetical protein
MAKQLIYSRGKGLVEIDVPDDINPIIDLGIVEQQSKQKEGKKKFNTVDYEQSSSDAKV